MSGTVYLRFSGVRSGSHRVPPRTAVETPPCAVSKKITLLAQINSFVQKIFDLLGLRHVVATILFDQIDYLLVPLSDAVH